MKTTRDDRPWQPGADGSAATTAALAAVLHRYLDHVDRMRQPPDLALLRSAAMELQARLEAKSEHSESLQRLHEWLEWDAPLFEPSPPAAPAARGDDPGQRGS
jgi:hypothetical protein